jgi:hypothetical protein
MIITVLRIDSFGTVATHFRQICFGFAHHPAPRDPLSRARSTPIISNQLIRQTTTRHTLATLPLLDDIQ